MKDVAEASFNEIVSPAGTQFIIPIWQRLYSWEYKELNDLWEDLMKIHERLRKGESAEHFLGPIVIKTVEEKVGEITRRVLIDGQQRLTTLLLICALIRDKAKAEGNERLANEIEDSLLFNKYAKKIEDKPKLRPTEADRRLFDLIINGERLEAPSEGSQLYFAYNVFKDLLETSKDKYDMDTLLDCIKKLKIVTIRLDERDNPNRIFETLNFRGRELAQSDLVRNYFMMAIRDAIKANQIYNDIWFPMQQGLGPNTSERIQNLEAFLRHYIVMNKHKFVKENQVYAEIRERLKDSSEDQVISELNRIRKYSQYYERLLCPGKEENAKIAKEIERLDRLKIGVYYPFLLRVYDAFNSADRKIDEDDFCNILRIIESYIVRRLFHQLPTNSLNRLFASLCGLAEDDLVASLQKELAEKEEWRAQYWPKDDEFKEDFQTVPMYKISPQRCRFVLETLEESFMHPEAIRLEGLTIEHIMPETLTQEWKNYLGKDWENTYNRYLNTIGNLTLVAGPPNVAIGNKLLGEKKEEWYKYSNVELTKEIAKKWDEWTQAQIKERAENLAERAVRIWARPK